MSAPTIKLTSTLRHKLLDLKLERSQAVTPGRVMLCKGRKVVGFCDVAELGTKAYSIAERCNTLCIAVADYDDVMRWLKDRAA